MKFLKYRKFNNEVIHLYHFISFTVRKDTTSQSSLILTVCDGGYTPLVSLIFLCS